MSSTEEWISDCIFDTCLVASQVIDHNSMPDRLSFATAMKIDEQMHDITVSAPTNWWDLDIISPQQEQDIDHLVDKLLIQFFFLHVRMYLHLPFLAATTPTEQLLISSQRCYTISEKMVRCYTSLRTPMKNGCSPFDCKTTDFVGFTAAVVLLVARRWRAALNMISVDELNSSLALVKDAEIILQGLNQTSSCNVIRQCYLSLRQMLHPAGSERIAIPYFGIAVLNPADSAHVEAGFDTQSTPQVEIDSGSVPIELELNLTYPYSQFGLPNFQGDCAGWRTDTSPLDINPLQWDIDEDWTLFL